MPTIATLAADPAEPLVTLSPEPWEHESVYGSAGESAVAPETASRDGGVMRAWCVIRARCVMRAQCECGHGANVGTARNVGTALACESEWRESDFRRRFPPIHAVARPGGARRATWRAVTAERAPSRRMPGLARPSAGQGTRHLNSRNRRSASRPWFSRRSARPRAVGSRAVRLAGCSARGPFGAGAFGSQAVRHAIRLGLRSGRSSLSLHRDLPRTGGASSILRNRILIAVARSGTAGAVQKNGTRPAARRCVALRSVPGKTGHLPRRDAALRGAALPSVFQKNWTRPRTGARPADSAVAATHRSRHPAPRRVKFSPSRPRTFKSAGHGLDAAARQT